MLQQTSPHDRKFIHRIDQRLARVRILFERPYAQLRSGDGEVEGGAFGREEGVVYCCVKGGDEGAGDTVGAGKGSERFDFGGR